MVCASARNFVELRVGHADLVTSGQRGSPMFEVDERTLGDEAGVRVAQGLLGVEALAVRERDQREQALAERGCVELLVARIGQRGAEPRARRAALELRRARERGQRERHVVERIRGAPASRARPP